MKTIKIFVIILLSFSSVAQEISEKEISSEIKNVTVFLEGAQIAREKQIDLPKGTTDLKFTALSPFIDPKTIQVKTGDNLTVLSVNHHLNYSNKTKKSEKIKNIDTGIKTLNEEIIIEQTHLKIIDERLSFLQENKVIGGKNEQLSIDNLKATSEFYGNQVSALLLNKIERNKKIELLNKHISDFNDEIRTISAPETLPSGEILIRVKSSDASNYVVQVSYLVSNAGWFPSYDIRAKTVNEPIEITYRANIRQDTKEDWNNISLTLSTSNPNTSNTAPEFVPYLMNYYNSPPAYITSSIHEVSGQVFDETNNPLVGATVTIPGSTIGTLTDTDGRYRLALPSNASQIRIDFLGCISQTIYINNSIHNIILKPSNVQLEDVVITSYGNQPESKLSNSLSARIAGVSISKNEDQLIPFDKIENQTSFNYEIQTPYSIKSDKKSFSLDIVKYSIPASYQYFAFPKADENAYLNAFITDWEKYNFLEGEANIFFENKFIGKTVLDVRYLTDSLKISLGKDKSVLVNIEKTKDFTKRQFIGNKKSETKSKNISIKNNKNKEINLLLVDQVPVPSVEDISLNIEELSYARYDKNTGKVSWEFALKPLEKKELTLKYTVKYPKNRSLKIE